MNTKYLIPIKNGFLLYQPESDIVYRGSRKTMEVWHILMIPFLTVMITPVVYIATNYVWPFLDLSRYRVIKYTLVMIISGATYYKFIYKKK